MTRQFLGACLFVLAATAAVYGGIGGHEFVAFDDDRYVFNNPVVLQGLSAQSVRWAFTTAEMGSWHPLTWLSHLGVVTLFGARPGPQHVLNATLHLLTALLLLRLMAALTGRVWPAALAAALWAVHPLHVESVAWVSERKDVLSAFFLVMTLIAWGRHLRRGGSCWYVLSLLLFACGLMAKPVVITLPFLLLLLDFWPFGRLAPGRAGAADWRRTVLEKIPFLVIALTSAALTYSTQRAAGALNPALLGHAGRRVANAVLAAAGYLADTVWPAGLIPFYPLSSTPPSVAAVSAAALFLAATTIATLCASRRFPALAVGWGWYLLTLLPVIGLVQAGGQARADRYTYLPLIGLFFAASWAGAVSLPRGAPRRIAGGAAIFFVLVLTVRAQAQVAVWRTTRTLFTHTLLVDPDNWMAHLILGNDDLDHGEIDAAGEHYRAVLRAEPMVSQASERLGTIELDYRRRPEEALRHYERALAIEPRSAVLHHNRGLALLGLQRLDQAEAAFRRALALDPGYFLAHSNLGVVLHRAARLEEAAAEYRAALLLKPGDARAGRNLELIRKSTGDAGP